ncbi:MAG: MFS transporter [Kiritimatiellales bacterium]
MYNKPLKFYHIVGYNLGKAIEVLMVTTVGNIALPFYSISLQINPAWIGAAMAFPRLLDAITDVGMGWLSDNTKSRWGRRRPWMFLGGLLSGFFFWLIWTPPVSWGNVGVFIYFLIMSGLFYIAMTLFLVPYYALGNEITDDHDVRVRVMGIRSLIWGVATIVTPWAYKLFYCPLFGDNEIEGARVVGLLIGLVCAVFAMISVFSSRENPQAMKQSYIPIGRALLDAISCRPFLNLIAVATLSTLGFGLVSGFNMFVGIYYVFSGDKAAMANLWGYVGMSWGIGAVVFSCFVEKIIRRIGEKPTLCLSLGLIILGSVSSWWAYTPRLPILAIMTTLLSAPGIIGVQTVSFVWLADICDYDEWKFGKRREGVFSSVQSFINKSIYAVAGGLAGTFAVAVGVNTTLSQQAASTVFKLRVLFAAVPASLAVFAFFFVYIYPLTRGKMSDIRRQLKSEREKKELEI